MGASTPLPAQPTQRLKIRQRRVLLLFGAASLVLHLIVLDALPGLSPLPATPETRVLDVVLVEPPAAPATAPEPLLDISPPPAKPAPKASPPAERRTPPRPKQTEVPAEPARTAPPGESREEPGAIPIAPPASVAPAPAPAREPESAARGAPAPQAKPEVTPPAFSASYLRNPAPRYPLIARRNGEQGTVTLRVLVARDGTPVRVTLEQSSGSRHLDDAALEAVRSWHFVPARRGGEAIEAWVLVPIVFRLEGAS